MYLGKIQTLLIFAYMILISGKRPLAEKRIPHALAPVIVQNHLPNIINQPAGCKQTSNHPFVFCRKLRYTHRLFFNIIDFRYARVKGSLC